MIYKNYIANCDGHKIGKVKRNMVVDTTHGVPIPSIIKEIQSQTEPGREVVVLVAGDDNKRQLEADGIHYYNIVGSVYIYEETESRSVSKINAILPFQHHDVLVVVGVNFIPLEIIQDIGVRHAGPLIYIGDSYLVDYYSGGTVIQMLNCHDKQYVDVSRMNGFSQELVFLANRMRRGVNDEIKPQKHRSYSFIEDHHPDDVIDAVLGHDIFICSRNDIGNYTRRIREDMFGYNSIPNIGETLVIYEAYYFRESSNTPHKYIPFGTMVKVLSVNETNAEYGYVDCRVETSSGNQFMLSVSMKFIDDTMGIVNEYPKVGAKAFYGYCVPPQVIMDKSFDRVMVEYKPLLVNNKRYLYSISRIARKHLTVYFDNNDPYLQ
ncbi:MAG: hypothetical protein ACRCZ9_12305 [Fusobacteriaceae bacterium]